MHIPKIALENEIKASIYTGGTGLGMGRVEWNNDSSVYVIYGSNNKIESIISNNDILKHIILHQR